MRKSVSYMLSFFCVFASFMDSSTDSSFSDPETLVLIDVVVLNLAVSICLSAIFFAACLGNRGIFSVTDLVLSCSLKPAFRKLSAS